MASLTGVKLAICQMPVVVGRPDLNVRYMRQEISDAKDKGVDIIFFPELSVTGYIIGDMFEREEFILDAYKSCDAMLREVTKDGITAIVGVPVYDNGLRGEDGRRRLYNAAVVYSDGKYIGKAIKTLQPNYRMFDDDRHFYSERKLAQENGLDLNMINNVFAIKLRDSRIIRPGVMLCEDGWPDDYYIDPSEALMNNGAELIINISASPWGWQKNRKRHSVVKELLTKRKVSMVYVNNTGLQNNGKNLIVFDGSSTVYNANGEVVYEVAPYAVGNHYFEFTEKLPVVIQNKQDDSRELYLAVHNAIKEFCSSFKKIIIGVSGGIDSAVAAAAYVDALGKDKVLGVFMPFSKYSSTESEVRARAIAESLGIEFRVVSIDAIVDSIAGLLSTQEGTLEYENIQARARMEVLAAIAQREGGVFVCNTNKVEAAFGYGTMYGDIAGALALLADMVKREVYQLGNYYNEQVFGRQVIPADCFNIAPTAELGLNQKDPFDYGNLLRRGYHDEMVRAFTEFRLGPEWFIEAYMSKQLEIELKLEAGTIDRLFPSAGKFVADLEKHWALYRRAFFKTNQMPPILIVSKRAFGYDLRRSMVTPHFTGRYRRLKAFVLPKEPRRIAIYGGSFNPPGLNHLQVVQSALKSFDTVIVVPCGPRGDKDSINTVTFVDRKNMIEMAFGDVPGVEIDWRDLKSGDFTPTYQLQEIYKAEFPDDEIWFVVGSDIVLKGSDGLSLIQRMWRQGKRIWQELNWAVIARSNVAIPADNMPPNFLLLAASDIFGSSSTIRQMVADGKDIGDFVDDEVGEYIAKKGLYR